MHPNLSIGNKALKAVPQTLAEHNAPPKASFFMLTSHSCPCKGGAYFATCSLTRLPVSDRTDWRRTDRQTMCGTMNDELIFKTQKAATLIANPAQLTAGRRTSQPACLHVSLHCCLSHSVLFMSAFLPYGLTMCLLLFLSWSVLHSMCISCAEKLSFLAVISAH